MIHPMFRKLTTLFVVFAVISTTVSTPIQADEIPIHPVDTLSGGTTTATHQPTNASATDLSELAKQNNTSTLNKTQTTTSSSQTVDQNSEAVHLPSEPSPNSISKIMIVSTPTKPSVAAVHAAIQTATEPTDNVKTTAKVTSTSVSADTTAILHAMSSTSKTTETTSSNISETAVTTPVTQSATSTVTAVGTATEKREVASFTSQSETTAITAPEPSNTIGDDQESSMPTDSSKPITTPMSQSSTYTVMETEPSKTVSTVKENTKLDASATLPTTQSQTVTTPATNDNLDTHHVEPYTDSTSKTVHVIDSETNLNTNKTTETRTVQETKQTTGHEIEKLRTRNTKTFENSDGTYTQRVYLDPIHYQDQATGNWKEIDSSLEVRNDGTYHNKSNNFDVSLPDKSKGGQTQFSANGASVTFQPVFTDEVNGTLSKNNKLTFTDATKDTDLSYEITPTSLKESLTLKKAPGTNTFTFNLNLNGLNYKEQPDGTVAIFKGHSSDPSFFLDKPFMYDANDQLSNGVTYKFRKDAQGNQLLDLIADPAWLQDPKRLYPVVIDPSFSTTSTQYFNSMVASQFPNGYDENNVTFDKYQTMLIGSSVNKGTTRPLLKFILPGLPTGAVITNATLNLDNVGYQSDLNPQQTPTIEVHRVTSYWDSHAVSWNNQPSIGGVDGSYLVTNQSIPYPWTIPVTSLVQDWYNGVQPNYGVELRYKNETDVVRSFLAAADTEDPNDHPFLSISFTIDGKGDEPYWTLDGPVNMGNMNLVLPVTDINYPGQQTPVSFTRTYNSRSKASGVLGYGWSTPMDMRLYAPTTGVARLVGSTGTTYYFSQDINGNYTSPDGLYLKLNVSGSTATLTTADKSVFTFNQVPNSSIRQFELSKATDIAGNGLTYGYNAQNQVTSISDGANHAITLSYNSNGLIESATDPSTRVWYYGYDSNLNLFKVTLPYSDPNGRLITYSYDNNHNLTSMKTPDGRISYVNYTTDPGDPTSFRLTSINPTNIIANGNFEVSSGGNNLPDHFAFYEGYDNGTINKPTVLPFDLTAFKLDTDAYKNPSFYSVYTSDQYTVNKNATSYTLSGYIKAIQNSGTQTTVLSLLAYDANHNVIQEVQAARIAVTGSTTNNGTISDWQRKSITFAPSALPANTVYVSVRLAASSSSGSGSSWWDGIQLEESNSASRFISGDQYTNWPPTLQTAHYDAEGRKTLYTYNSDQNLNQTQVDPDNTNLKRINDWASNQMTSTKDPNGNTWTYQYDPVTGKLSYSKDGNGGTETFTYNNNADTLTHKTVTGTTLAYTYDILKNVLTAHNESGTSTSQIHDARGRLTSATNAVGMADNLLENSSFEQGLNGFIFNKGVNGTWGLDTTAASVGNRDFKINFAAASPSASTSVTSDPALVIVPSSAYLLAGDIKSVSQTGTQKTVLSVLAYNSANVEIGEVGKLEVDGTTEWRHVRTQIVPTDLPVGTSTLRLKMYGANDNGIGTSYFDAVQLQQYGVDTEYNLTDNSSFELPNSTATFPMDWSPSDSGTSKWENSGYTGNHAASITNATTMTGIRSTTFQPYNSTLSYTLTTLVKTTNLSGNVGRIRIGEYDANYNQIGVVDSNTLGGTTDWTMLTALLGAGQATPGTTYIRPVLVTDNATGTVYFDNVRLVSGSVGTTKYSYANGKDLSSTTDQMNHTTAYEYDNQGNVTKETDANNNATVRTYDPFTGQLATLTTANQDVTTFYQYDKDGHVTFLYDKTPNQVTTYNTTGITYNSRGQKANVTDGLSRVTDTYYTPNGLLESIYTPTGAYVAGTLPSTKSTVSYAYNSANQLTDKYLGSIDRYHFTYDKNGNILSIYDSVSKITYTALYDADNRLYKWSDGQGTLTYDLTSSGMIKGRSLTLPSVATPYSESLTFNVLDQLMNLKDINKLDNRVLYGENGNLSMLRYGNNIVESIDYDDAGHIVQVQNTSSTGAILSTFKYEYFENGWLKSSTSNSGKTSYTYTKDGQLLTETSPSGIVTSYSYIYDATKNPYGQMSQRQVKKTDGTTTTTTYTYDKGNQLLQAGSISYSYDNAGNVTKNGIYTYTWDDAGRMIQSVNTQTGEVATYLYDNLDRRVQETVGNKTTKFLYDGNSDHVLAEFENSVMTKYYTWGPLGLLGITTYDTNGAHPYYVVKNARGDIVELRNATGALVYTYTYDAWGALVNSTDLTNVNPYRYADYRYDSHDGLYYLMSRYYDPSVGRFLSKDAAYAKSSYAYAGYNPNNYVDPTGFHQEETGYGGGGSWLAIFMRTATPVAVKGMEFLYSEERLQEIGDAMHEESVLAETANKEITTLSQLAQRATPETMIKSLEKNSGWEKSIEPGGKVSGPATIFTNTNTGYKFRIHANPMEGKNPYFRAQNKGGGYLDENGLFPSNATKQELRDLTHFNYNLP
ncbi:DNRLRE domain-containing protein [Tumebacillus sp. ITR2]|uniref:DNRLRE domain-containing protein n=1 Tax=Tumebacillus amylolyticus TaxID=2801339 RepID=A0ABS1J9I3_9BACL|nr:DNRLRE domain-containing protein [Tumebacillus amylolyticus]MBL0386934.1 DNRLRE domain-containing protein [Tumebacillus amylolyticus]